MGWPMDTNHQSPGATHQGFGSPALGLYPGAQAPGYGSPSHHQNQGSWGVPPPQQQQPYGYPPSRQPPHNGFAASPPLPGTSQFPPAQPGFGMGVTPPSLGYIPGQMAQGDATIDADALRKAMKRWGTNEKTLIRILSKPDPLQMALLRHTYVHRHGKSLEEAIIEDTSGYFKKTLLALVRGPLEQDVFNLHEALEPAGTKERMLNDVVLGRSNADLNTIKRVYYEKYKEDLEQKVASDLSFNTQKLFSMVMSARRNEESSPCIPQQVDQDVHDLRQYLTGTKQTIETCKLLSERSDGQLRAIVHAYNKLSPQKSLEKKLEEEFSGHMEDALILMVRSATDPAMKDALMLEEAMAGIGTKDDLLLNRVVRIHWNPRHMDQVKKAYKHQFKKDLVSRVRGETSGDYKDLLCALLE